MLDPTDFSQIESEMMNRHQRRSELNLRFYTDAIENKTQSLEAGRPIYMQIDFVAINVPGSRDEVIRKVDAEIKQRFGAQYEHWKKTQEQPTEGQPLDMVPWLNVAQIRELQALNIKSLEQLAGLSDTAIQHIGMGGHDLRKKAQAYMASATGSAEVQRLITRISELERENGRLQDVVKQINQRYEALVEQTKAPIPVATVAPAPAAPASEPRYDIAELIRAEVAKALQPKEPDHE